MIKKNWSWILIFYFLFEIKFYNVQAITCNYGFVSVKGSCEACGTTDSTPNIKIVGGIPAVRNSWPAQALVIQSYKANVRFGSYGVHTVTQKFQCGGTLIDDQTILTAAHCIAKDYNVEAFGRIWTVPVTLNSFYPTWASMFKVYLGTYDKSFIENNRSPTSPTIELTPREVITHPSYDSNNQLNDIALLKLSTSVKSSANIKYACLPDKKSTTIPAENQAVYTSGWGTLNENGRTPNNLYNVKLSVYSPAFCSVVAPSYQKNWNSQICAGELRGGKDTCEGDSGGGMYIYDTQVNKYIVVGITSYGDGCAKPGRPGIYTRISNYVDWIRQNS